MSAAGKGYTPPPPFFCKILSQRNLGPDQSVGGLDEAGVQDQALEVLRIGLRPVAGSLNGCKLEAFGVEEGIGDAVVAPGPATGLPRFRRARGELRVAPLFLWGGEVRAAEGEGRWSHDALRLPSLGLIARNCRARFPARSL